MRKLGMLASEQPLEQQIKEKWAKDEPKSTLPDLRTEVFIKQWRDSAGAYHTDAFLEEPVRSDYGGYREGNFASCYALTRFGAWQHKYMIRIKAKRELRKIRAAEEQKITRGGWKHTDDPWQSKEREFKVKL